MAETVAARPPRFNLDACARLLPSSLMLRGALSEPDVRRLVLADLLSLIGSGAVPVALSFALAARGEGAGAIGAVLFAQTAPLALLLLPGGMVADRWSPRPVMVAADLLRFCVQSLLATALWCHRAPLSVIVGFSAVLGAGDAFALPGRSALLLRIVPPDRLQGANALLAMASSVSTLLGPALGGILVATVGAQAAVGLDAASFLASAILLLGLRLLIARPERARTATVGASFADGWRAFVRHRWIWLLAVQASLVFLLSWGPLLVLGALRYAALPHGSVRWGALLSALGAGVGLGAMLGGRLALQQPIRACLIGFLFYPSVPLGIALHWPFAVQAGCMLCAGAGFGVYNVLWETSLQRTIPAAMLSRVSAFDQFSSVCMLPLGYVAAAPLSHWLGTDRALWIGALVTAGCICGCLCLRDIREAPRPMR